MGRKTDAKLRTDEQKHHRRRSLEASWHKTAKPSGLLLQVAANANIKRAWQQVRANKGAAGIDGIGIEQFSEWVKPQWRDIREQLLSRNYHPQPVKRVRIPKEDGTDRLLGIPTVLDRVIQQAIVQVLSPRFDPTFAEQSYGFRPNRSAHDAIRQVQGYCQQKRRTAVDIDLAKFFDRVNHDKLMTLLGGRIRDKGLLQLIGRYLRAGVMDGDGWLPSREGVPQGGPLSPLLANVMLDPCRVRELTQRSKGVSMAAKIQGLSRHLRGWINYYGIANQYQQCVDLDHWIRRRIRMCYWKQWGRPRTKIRNLIKLGVSLPMEVACGISSKGWWRSSKSPGINQALGLNYLKQQGLFSLRDGWIALHYGK